MHIEDIGVGDHIMIVRGVTKPKQRSSPFGFPLFDSGEEIEDDSKNGIPIKVLAINAPFVLGQMMGAENQQGMVIDVRKMQLTKCGGDYIAAFDQLLDAARERIAEQRQRRQSAGGPMPFWGGGDNH